MKILRSTLFLVLVLNGLNSTAQQLGLYNLYNQNLYLINPAAVGIENNYTGFVNHSKQWAGVDNSPTLSGITFNGRMGRTQGLGTNLQFANVGLLTQFSGKVSYAYHLKVGAASYLHGGFSMGVNHQKLDMGRVIATDYTDQLLTDKVPTGWGVSNDVGLMFTMPRVRLGVAFPETFNTNKTLSISAREKFNAYAAYDIISNDKWNLESSVLYRLSDDQKNQLDVFTKLMWKNTIGLGALYRTNYGIAGIVQLNINEKLMVGYSYGNAGNSALGGSHGILLGVKLRKKSRKREENIKQDIIEQVPVAVPEEQPIEEVRAPAMNEPVLAQAETKAPEAETKQVDLHGINDKFNNRDHLIRFEHASRSNVISDNLDRVVGEAALILQDNPSFNAIVIGHASSVGDIIVNQNISEARAAIIANALIGKGIAPSRITQIGKGELEPIADNKTVEGAEENRRVQIIFVQ